MLVYIYGGAIVSREIIKVNEPVIGFDFDANPTRGNNRITTTYQIIINNGDEYEKINDAPDYIQKVN